MSAIKITTIVGSLLFAISAISLANRTADFSTIKPQEPTATGQASGGAEITGTGKHAVRKFLGQSRGQGP